MLLSRLSDVAAPPRSAALSFEARRAFGGLLPLIDDPELQDLLIQVSGGVGGLWLDRGEAPERVAGWEAPVGAVRELAIGLIAAGGRHLDELHPCADVHLGGGIRAHAVLPPVAVSGTAISVRLPRAAPPRFEDLVAGGLCDPATAGRLAALIGARRNLLISGGTGTGKTTLLAALLDLAPARARIITIEDVAELRLSHPNRVSLEARQANAEGAGEIGVDRLLREALRMRPDRIVLGECRGAELVTMLSALNTGHDGAATTLHASRLEGVPARLEALGALAGLDAAALARQAASALHFAVHLERDASGSRRVGGLGRFRLRGEVLALEPV
ncbi:Flp pilus assembly complex ATPase component TadA [Leucobacter weissii]|uniref:Flp pilus assembly complex ATPase component TadA n=1 Tax=Leucobacter weissii TaxID=1983706 RepID=A0A939MKI2_9MICO|nr:ATPase, T2SS/T4P/T4SS family [Leucobacter weissii]MBO1901620.1 Flp pilus assembly complex ATPase component TadA [Leucobacter weissii]